MAVRRRTAAIAVATVFLTAVPAVLTSCAGSAADQVNYAVDGVLSSYNTNTVPGAASAGPQAFGRALTGFSLHGPDGQVLTDRDFGSVSVVGREPLVLDYQIADDAVILEPQVVEPDMLPPAERKTHLEIRRAGRRRNQHFKEPRQGALRLILRGGDGGIIGAKLGWRGFGRCSMKRCSNGGRRQQKRGEQRDHG